MKTALNLKLSNSQTNMMSTFCFCVTMQIVNPKTYERQFVAYDASRVPVRSSREKELSTVGKYSKWILVLRRVFSKDKSLWKTKLDVKSPLILDVLKEVVKEEAATLVTEGSITWPNDKVFRFVSNFLHLLFSLEFFSLFLAFLLMYVTTKSGTKSRRQRPGKVT